MKILNYLSDLEGKTIEKVSRDLRTTILKTTDDCFLGLKSNIVTTSANKYSSELEILSKDYMENTLSKSDYKRFFSMKEKCSSCQEIHLYSELIDGKCTHCFHGLDKNKRYCPNCLEEIDSEDSLIEHKGETYCKECVPEDYVGDDYYDTHCPNCDESTSAHDNFEVYYKGDIYCRECCERCPNCDAIIDEDNDYSEDDDYCQSCYEGESDEDEDEDE